MDQQHLSNPKRPPVDAVTVPGMWTIRPIGEDEVDLFRSRLARGFGGDPSTDESARKRFVKTFELERTFAAFDQDDLVGTGGAFSFQLTVPGGAAVPMGGTTVISVQPTHRRRGVLTEMMRYHLEEVTGHGEPLAGLWASESSIYGRFGYGMATERHHVSLNSTTFSMSGPLPAGRVRLAEPDEAEKALRDVYERVRPTVPGMLARSDSWWEHRVMRDDKEAQGDRSRRRYALYQVDGVIDGYASYRQKENWSGFTSSGEVDVSEVIAVTDDAHTALWHFLCNIDLFSRLEYWNAPVDDPLPHKVTDPRRVERRLADALWLRVLDVPAALEARSYETDGAITMRGEDRFRPQTSGIYELEVSAGVGRCQQTEASPRITAGIEVLGELLLGGGNAMALAAAGRLSGPEASLRALHRLFRTDRAPWCEEVF